MTESVCLVYEIMCGLADFIRFKSISTRELEVQIETRRKTSVGGASHQRREVTSISS